MPGYPPLSTLSFYLKEIFDSTNASKTFPVQPGELWQPLGGLIGHNDTETNIRIYNSNGNQKGTLFYCAAAHPAQSFPLPLIHKEPLDTDITTPGDQVTASDFREMILEPGDYIQVDKKTSDDFRLLIKVYFTWMGGQSTTTRGSAVVPASSSAAPGFSGGGGGIKI